MADSDWLRIEQGHSCPANSKRPKFPRCRVADRVISATCMHFHSFVHGVKKKIIQEQKKKRAAIVWEITQGPQAVNLPHRSRYGQLRHNPTLCGIPNGADIPSVGAEGFT